MPQEELELVPVEARDPSGALLIHWGVLDEGADPFLSGAYWALGWSLSTIFGSQVGALLDSLTRSNVERWNGSQWVPVA